MRQGVFSVLKWIDKASFFFLKRRAILNLKILFAHLVARPSRVSRFSEERLLYLPCIHIARSQRVGIPAYDIDCAARSHFACKSPTINAIHTLKCEPVSPVVPRLLEHGKYARCATSIFSVFNIGLSANGFPAFNIPCGHAKAQICIRHATVVFHPTLVVIGQKKRIVLVPELRQCRRILPLAIFADLHGFCDARTVFFWRDEIHRFHHSALFGVHRCDGFFIQFVRF